jgi:enoyl-CoA hydratase
MLNALSFGVFREIRGRRRRPRADDKIGCILLTGSEKAFRRRRRHQGDAAEGLHRHVLSDFAAIGGDRVAMPQADDCRVSGYALGGGCELAMMCDIIIAVGHRQIRPAGNHARHHPGIGGTQRLTRAIGKSKAMDLLPHRRG